MFLGLGLTIHGQGGGGGSLPPVEGPGGIGSPIGLLLTLTQAS